MNRELTFLARLVAFVSALTFVALMTVTILAFATQRQFLRPTTYIRALTEVNAYDRAPDILAELVIFAFDGARTGLAQQLPFPDISQNDVALFLSLLLPREWLQSQTEIIVHRAIAGLKNEPTPAPPVLSLVEIKQRLNGPEGARALIAVVETRPACAATDFSALTCGFNLAGEITCRPPGLNLEVCSAVVGLAAGGMASLLPDQVDLDAVLQASQPFTAPLRDYAHRYASAISLLARFGWFAALPFLLGVTLFGVRSFAGWLRWWGLPFLGIAVCLLPFAAATLIWPTWYIAGPLDELAQGAPSLAQLLSDVAGILSRGVVLNLGVAILLLGAMGVGMLTLSFIAPAVQRWINQG